MARLTVPAFPAGRAGLFTLLLFAAQPAPVLAQSDDLAAERETALSIATMLRSARGVIGSSQDLINDETRGDKGLTGDVVLKQAIAAYVASAGTDPREVDPSSLEGRLLAAQMEAIDEVMAENQSTINREGVGFKGFVPAVFARLVNERFSAKAGDLAAIKVTAPAELVRNRKARPDDWESDVIETRLSAEDWPEGKVFDEVTDVAGKDAYRVLVPEYYGEGCLACHGGPAGEIDVTGYPKEGGHLGDLGGVISITLYR